MTGGSVEANQINTIGNGGRGIIASRTRLSIEEAGTSVNDGNGLYGLYEAAVNATKIQSVGNNA